MGRQERIARLESAIEGSPAPAGKLATIFLNRLPVGVPDDEVARHLVIDAPGRGPASTRGKAILKRASNMATLTVRYDIATPRFVHGFVYEGEETERAALKKAMQEEAVKAGINTETWLQSVVITAPKVLPDAAPDARQRMNSAITAWALDLSAGHPTRHGTIDEFLNDSDFLVIITKAIDGEISCEVHATSKCAGSA